ncbi:MAG TPA: 2-aminoethylphosphonate--pyruvate transaminase [Desulfobacterales bacterium]|nr:2-aminoethylphosphonate--pyruvate transaminase [Desulfobacterales bacterium]
MSPSDPQAPNEEDPNPSSFRRAPQNQHTDAASRTPIEERRPMDTDRLPDNPYLLLTPGPLSTSKRVKAAMLRDWCTWDDDYNAIVEEIRRRLVALATPAPGYTAVLMQGSGTFCVEATLTTAVPDRGKLLVLANGAYGRRIAEIARRCGIAHVLQEDDELAAPDLARLEAALGSEPGLTHVAVVHCETGSGMLNPLAAIAGIVKTHGRCLIVDAMSSFGGIPLDVAQLDVDYLISSANKCIQGVPGFGFVIAKRAVLSETRGQARSLSLDLYDQWHTMEDGRGKWRFTSPTHVVHAFFQALEELAAEGGVAARHRRYCENQRILTAGMQRLGFQTLLSAALQSPIITTFLCPPRPAWQFKRFYQDLKAKGFLIYPGKVTERDTFRIGTIGAVHPTDVERLIAAIPV